MLIHLYKFCVTDEWMHNHIQHIMPYPGCWYKMGVYIKENLELQYLEIRFAGVKKKSGRNYHYII